MDAIHDEADVFAISNLYKTSTWLDQLTRDASSSLFTQGFGISSSNENPNLPPLAPISPETQGFFKAPQVDKTSEAGESGCIEPSEASQSASPDAIDDDARPDPWIDSDTSAPLQPPVAFRTWESFQTGQLSPHAPLFLSESGAAVYDALLSWSTDPLELENAKVPVVDTKAYFASILALSVGRESVLFRKDHHDGTFKRTLTEFRISGYTSQLLRGVETQAKWCGATFVKLAAFARLFYTSSSNRCAVALASAVKQALRAVEHGITVDGRDPKSLLRLQATIKETSAILRPLQGLTEGIPQDCTDEYIISLVFQETSALDFSDKFNLDMFCEILRRVSSPWVETVEEWLGTRREAGTPFTKANLGEIKGFIKVDAEVLTDDFGRDVEDVKFCLDVDKVPQFLPMEMAESILETGRNLRFIREFHPDHPLSQTDVVLSHHPPEAEWLFDWNSILQLEKRVKQYQEQILETIQQNLQQNLSSTRTSVVDQAWLEKKPSETTAASCDLDFFGLDRPALEQRLLGSMNRLSQPLTVESMDDGSLESLIRARLSQKHGKEGVTAFDCRSTPHWSLVPILSFGAIASAQACVVHSESLRLLFEGHDVRRHLKLQRDFHLLGEGLFSSRLSHALFDPELKTAERRAGVAIQGGVMGLRLGGRDTWPPASSELRLALMGVLSEAYEAQGQDGVRMSRLNSTSPGAASLPGDLSFAVRDLSEEEIERCRDPDALEALDFLRLSYTTPSQLASIISPLHLLQYDRIFRHLLRILRMLHVVGQLHRDTNSRTDNRPHDNASYRFVRESQHFVRSIASYSLGSGVAIPWQAFEEKLDNIQTRLSRFDMAVEDRAAHRPSQIADMHSQVLERILHALFLRKRQQPILKLLEEIFSIILLFAKQSRLLALGKMKESHGAARDSDQARLYADFQKKLTVFITVCRGLSEKARSSSKRTAEGMVVSSESFGIGYDSLIAQLLTKLDLGGYYGRHGSF